METKITYTFSFKIDDRPYDFSVVAVSRKEALSKLSDDLATLMSQINSEWSKESY